ncbi:site-specific integrase [Halobacteriovorax sp. HLS]|uniref:tyrosine-type recombinase/integrase n=1 Tax=Halobacteriovorax sp. HLS TaxID=2234000 RepID=UPI000FD9A5FF|nr:site-specific integrase [Halobacteriovorax sp. HLS]
MNKKNQIWLDSFLKNCEELNKSEHTIRNYKCDLEKYILWYEATYLTAIDIPQKNCIEQYKSFLLNGGSISKKTNLLTWFFSLFILRNILIINHSITSKALSNNSAKRHISSIKSLYEFLRQTHDGFSKKFSTNPVKDKIHKIKVKEIDVNNTKILPKEVWRELIESTYRTKERVILQLLYWGGLRLSELTQLKYSHFDFSKRELSLHRKGGYIHEFRIQNEEEIFKNIRFLKDNDPHGGEFIFTNSEGKCLSTRSMYNLIKKLISRVANDAQLTPHSFRKACATNLYDKTKDLLLVRDYLGHHDAKVTQTYIERKKGPIL